MATQAQLDANRRNAQLSTGPRTDEGKAVSRRNAMQHGLRAEHSACVGEDVEEFEAFAAEIVAALRPVGAVERDLVRRVAFLKWKLGRLPAIEEVAMGRLAGSTRMQSGFSRETERLTLPQIMANDFFNNEALSKLQMYEQRLERSIRLTMTELRQLRKDRAAEEEEDEASAPPAAPADRTPAMPAAPAPRDSAERTQFCRNDRPNQALAVSSEPNQVSGEQTEPPRHALPAHRGRDKADVIRY